MIENYEKILEKISKASKLEKEEIERRVEAKRAKLSGLISKEGAAQVIAAELGISFDNEKLKIQELLPGMRKVKVIGKIIKLSPVRSFIRNGKEGKVTDLILADETSNIKVVLWDTNHIGLIEKKEIGEGSIIEISNGSMRGNEIHLGSFSELKLSNEILESVHTERVFKEKEIADLKVAENVKVRAFIVQIFEPRFFDVCSECKKKVSSQEGGFVCESHGKIIPEKRALINLVLDDGTETIRAILFNEHVTSLGIDLENFSGKKQELLGKEAFFLGNIRNNKFFNKPEVMVDKIDEINIDELIVELEKG